MHAFSWGLFGSNGPKCVQFYMVDVLAIRIDTYDGHQQAPFVYTEGGTQQARARLLQWTAEHEQAGFVFDGEVYAAEVPEHMAEALQGWLRNEPTGFSTKTLLVALSPHWEPLS